MALSSIDYKVVDVTQTTYAFSFDFVRIDHVSVFVEGILVPSGDTTFAGQSGASSVTLSGTTFSNLEVGDDLRIEKVTPQTFAGRTVDFSAIGTVTEAALDDAILHTISLAQDAIDDAEAGLRFDIDLPGYDAQLRQIKRMESGVDAQDAVTVAQLQAVTTSSGALPAVDSSFNDFVLAVSAGNWGTKSPSGLSTILKLGTSATRDVGVGNPDEIIDRSLGDARYLQSGNNLSELTLPATARSNLGLGSAAVEPAGSGANDVLKLDGSGNIPAGVGLDPAVSFVGTSVFHKGGGLRDHISITKLVQNFNIAIDNDGVAISDDFETENLNNVGIVDIGGNTPTYEFRNTTPQESAPDAVGDDIALNTGTWEIDLSISIMNTDGTDQRVGVSLYDKTDSNLIEKLNSVNRTVAKGNSATTTYHLHTLYTVAGGTSEIVVRVATVTGAGALYVVNGQVRCHMLST